MVCQDMTNAVLRGNPHPRLNEGNGRMGAAGALLRCVALACAACAWTGRGAPVPPAALPGNHPDPSICRAGNAYYLVTSSNKWYPGLPVYRSENLRDWTRVGHAASGHDWGRLPASPYCEWGLTDNFGLWAPTIRWHDGTFYIVCTLLDAGPRRPGHHNFIVTAKDPAGPWSAPMWIDGGYDPSLFFDDDGKVYLITVGINMAEFDPATGQTKGPFRQIAKGLTETSVAVEAPHLYKMKGRYLLILAEGGTERGHCTAAFVSDDVWGPYRACSHNPVITARGQGERVTVRNKGHADLVETPEGDLYAVFLGVRGEVGKPDYPFGRETFLCRASFDGENLRFDDENLLAGAYVEPKTEDVLPHAGRELPPASPHLARGCRDAGGGERAGHRARRRRLREFEPRVLHAPEDGRRDRARLALRRAEGDACEDPLRREDGRPAPRLRPRHDPLLLRPLGQGAQGDR